MKKLVISLDIGGTNMRAALSDDKYKVTVTSYTSNDTYGSLVNFYIRILELIDSLSAPMDKVVNISVGLPGRVRENGKVDELINVGIKNVDLVELLSEHYNKPVYVRNDAEMALLAETFLGEGKNYKGVYFITVSTGVGGAFAYDKSIKNYGREIGHTPILYKGKYYDFEKLCSGTGLKNLAKLNGLKVKNAKELFQLVALGNELAIKIVDEWVDLFTEFLQFIYKIYKPDVFTFTGGVFKSKEYFFDKLKNKNPNLNLKECYFKEDAGLMGGVCLGISMIK